VEGGKFYRKHKTAMDKGGKAGWRHRVRPGELSAIQTAWNIRLEVGEGAFASEYQNEPRQQSFSAAFEVTHERVQEQVGPHKRGVIPPDCELMTVGLDVNLYGITFAVVAWRQDGAGFVVDYGKYPPGAQVKIWTPQSPQPIEQVMHAAIVGAVQEVMRRPYQREDGHVVTPALMGIDCSFERTVVTNAVRQARAIAAGSRVAAVRGVSGRHYHVRGSLRKGDGWHIAPWPTENVLFVNVDTWRARMQRAWLIPAGAAGSLTLYAGAPDGHATFARHVAAERLVDILSGSKMEEVYVWTLLPGEKNDFADAVVYAMCGAASMGVVGKPPKIEKPEGDKQEVPQEKPKEVPVVKKPVNNLYQRPDRGRGGFVNRW